jgi:hypothetical protein
MNAPKQEKRSRAGICLLLYFFGSSAVMNSIPAMQSNAEKLGAISVPLAMLAAGCWFAYKDGGRVARSFAAILALVTLGSFGFGVVSGYRSHEAARELDVELTQIRSGMLKDAASTELASDMVQRQADRTRGAAQRMADSKNGETAAVGRAMQAISSLTLGVDQRFGAGVDAVSAPNFWDEIAMLETGDFATTRSILVEYKSASQAAGAFYKNLPTQAEQEIAKSGMDAEYARQMLNGMRKTAPMSVRVFEAHVHSADTYLAAIDFLEAHAASITVSEAGEILFDSENSGEECDVLYQAIDSATERVNAAVDALTAHLSKG